MTVEQIALPLPSSGPTATRREAYEDSLADRPRWRDRVYRELLSRGSYGATCDELEVALGCQFTTAGAIIIALRDEGWVIDSGFTRLTRRDHRAVVYVGLAERAESPVFVRRGKGKWEAACRQAYALMECGGYEDAMSVLAHVLGKC